MKLMPSCFMRVEFLNRAKSDLLDIVDYLNELNPKASIAIFQRIEQRIMQLSSFPEIGVQTRANQRRLVVYDTDYIVFYRITAESIQIIRILHGKRRISRP